MAAGRPAEEGGDMTIYGLLGFTHGWGRVLTVMSPQGNTRLNARIEAGDEVIVTAGEGRLTQYQERRAGALDRLVAAHGIVLLDKAEWDARKAEAGARIWR